MQGNRNNQIKVSVGRQLPQQQLPQRPIQADALVKLEMVDCFAQILFVKSNGIDL